MCRTCRQQHNLPDTCGIVPLIPKYVLYVFYLSCRRLKMVRHRSLWRRGIFALVIKWQVRHYQRCFNTFMLVYGLVLSVLIVKFAVSFKPYSVELEGPDQTLDDEVLQARGTVLRNIDAAETGRQLLHPEEIKWMSAPFFPRAMNRSAHDRYVQLLRVLSQLFLRNNVTFIMCDGTLLGSYLSHGMLPWDDDVDLMVRYSDINKIKNIFSNVSIWKTYQILGYHDDINEYDYSLLTEGAYLKDGDPAVVYEEEIKQEQSLPADTKAGAVIDANKNDLIFNYRPYADYTESFQFQEAKQNATQQRYHKFKFFYRDSPFAGSRSWKWPFIDVKYYLENRTHVWTLDKRSKWVPRSIFYPLHLRPFASMWLPAPRDTRSFLRNKYGRFRCRSSRWNHRIESRQTPKKVRCWRLHSYYPFVWRDQSPAGVIESLMQDSRVIHSVVVAENFQTWQRQFEL